ncbi:MAG: class I SAM-dependent methyltransferase [Bacteroidia bacterium]
MQKQDRIRKGINFLAPIYQSLAHLFFGKKIFESQIYFLSEINKASSVLIIGGGNGKLLIELLKQNTTTNYYYLDVSDKMISETKRRVEKKFPKKNYSIIFHCGSEKDLPKNYFFDLIITPFVLDFFSGNELQQMMQRLDEKLSPQGKWLFCDFHISKSPRWMYYFSKLIVRLLYFFFNIFCALGVTELPCFEKYFFDLGYCSISKKYFLKGLIIAQLYTRQ